MGTYSLGDCELYTQFCNHLSFRLIQNGQGFKDRGDAQAAHVCLLPVDVGGRKLGDCGVAEISKCCGEMWKEVDEASRKKYEKKQAELKKKYDIEYPRWLESGGKELLDAAKAAKKAKKAKKAAKAAKAAGKGAGKRGRPSKKKAESEEEEEEESEEDDE